MNKIIGSSKDLGKKSGSGLTQPPKDSSSGLTDDSAVRSDAKKGLIVPGPVSKEKPFAETGLELPPTDERKDVDTDEITEEDLRVYRAACQYVSRFMADVSALDINTLAEHAQKIIQRTQGGDGLLRLAMRPVYIETFLGAHPVNVAAIASLVMAEHQPDKQRQLRAVVAGMVHDVGMSRLNVEILQNQRDLTPEEKQELEQHPNYGADIILEKLGAGYAWLAKVVQQEHERAQGQGYPHGLTLDKIDPLAQLLGLLDVYEAIIHPRRQHDAFCPSKAIKQVIETRNEYFAPQMIRGLLEAVSVFPIETYVLLNTGQIGRVSSTHRQNPLRPVIQVLTDHNRRSLPEPKKINLKEYPVLSIVKSLDAPEVEELIIT